MSDRITPKVITFVGVAPFIIITAALWANVADKDMWGAALVSYSALVLSFVGGIHWGFAICCTLSADARRMMFFESAMFVITAWIIAFAPIIISYKLIGLMILFGNIWIVDKLYARRLPLPEWFIPTRAIASAIVMVSLVLAAGATI